VILNSKKLAEIIIKLIIMGVMKNQATASSNASRSFDESPKGFSLVELVTCLAILGILVAMSLPSLAGIIETSVSSKARHQAQTIAQTYAAARAAGVVFAEPSREGVVEALTQPSGVRGRGIFAEMTFRVAMSPEEKAAVMQSTLLVSKTMPDGTLELECRLEGGL
jgi:prepilin-type N-terminal cleavage/methylation domain-containing protein